jgi:hypothetical protein
MRFKVLENIEIFGNILLNKGEIISIDKEYYECENSGMTIKLSVDQIKNDKRFSIIEDLKFDIQEIEDDWDVIKTWRMQLDITCSKRKLRSIQDMIQEKLDKIC